MPARIARSQGSRKSLLRALAPAAWVAALSLAALSLAALPRAADADTLATFDWVPYTNGGSGTGSGDLVLTLPGTVSGPTFDVSFGSASAAMQAVTGFSYTFSDGYSLDLADLQAGDLSLDSNTWETTDIIQPAGAPQGVYLGSNFSFGGYVMLPGLGETAYSFKVASSGGNVELAAGANQLIITDTGYWELESLTPVPLPAAGWLLVSGLAALWGASRGGRFGRRAMPAVS